METPIVVTGATGFVGKRLITRLHAMGYNVRAFVLPQEEGLAKQILPASTEIVCGDIANKDEVEKALCGAKTVFHLAAVVKDWGEVELHTRVTVGGTSNVLSVAAQYNAKVILCSSVVVYGDKIGKQVCTEDISFGKAKGVYSRSKQQQEILAREYQERKNLRVVIVRPTNIYGPNSGPWVQDLSKHLKSSMPSLIGNGEQNAGLCHVENFIDFLILAAESAKSVGEVYNVCDDSDITWKRYIGDISNCIGTPKPYGMPLFMAEIGAEICEKIWSLFNVKSRPPITKESINLIGSNHRIPISKAKNDLGFEPRIKYETAMQEIREYLANEKNLA